ncbi:hypothetical protein HK104_009081, partial [Borealophlyctis nickersoniae]
MRRSVTVADLRSKFEPPRPQPPPIPSNEQSQAKEQVEEDEEQTKSARELIKMWDRERNDMGLRVSAINYRKAKNNVDTVKRQKKDSAQATPPPPDPPQQPKQLPTLVHPLHTSTPAAPPH